MDLIAISKLVAVVVDPAHVRFGQVATIQAHYWNVDGCLHLSFDDGKSDLFDDGLMENDPPPQAVVIERNDSKVEELVQRLPRIKEELRHLQEAFGTSKELERKAIRNQFHQLLFSDEK